MFPQNEFITKAEASVSYLDQPTSYLSIPNFDPFRFVLNLVSHQPRVTPPAPPNIGHCLGHGPSVSVKSKNRLKFINSIEERKKLWRPKGEASSSLTRILIELQPGLRFDIQDRPAPRLIKKEKKVQISILLEKLYTSFLHTSQEQTREPRTEMRELRTQRRSQVSRHRQAGKAPWYFD